MALKDLDTFFDPDLHLPIRGKKYTVAAPDWDTVKRLRVKVFADDLPPLEQSDDAVAALGAAVDQMAADGVPWPMILHAGRTAMLHWVSPELAEIHWSLAQLGTLVNLDAVTAYLAEQQKGRVDHGA
ncbi:DUF7426 family protein [Prescottella equi]|uniref:DUF7426 family protein n=1 Tax=Rhodococcus hoagii TaxID=43767 RepID=UPI000A10DA71|nr:hypothetical protein [Prescottella equi]ORL06453.1 hypothetical protein A6I84_19170 [Prescottella equi]